MPFRSDAEIESYLEAAMAEIGRPRCLFIAGLIDKMGLEPQDIEYHQLAYPFDDPAWAKIAAPQQSGCGLVTRAGWRFAGVQAPEIYLPYQELVVKGGTHFVVAYERQFAIDVGAWVDAIPWVEGTPLPGPSDSVIIGCASCPDFARGTANYEHEFTFGAWDPEIPWISHNLDGGQPGTAFRSRGWVEVWTGTNAAGQRTGELWCGAINDKGEMATTYDGRPATGRRALGYVNTALLPMDPPPGNECRSADGKLVSNMGTAILPGVKNEYLVGLGLLAAGSAALMLTAPGRALLARFRRRLRRR